MKKISVLYLVLSVFLFSSSLVNANLGENETIPQTIIAPSPKDVTIPQTIITPGPNDVTISYEIANDGSDDSRVIQEAIDTVSLKGGGNVYIPKGKYIINSIIILKNKVNIIGDSRETELVFTDDFSKGNTKNPNSIYISGIWNESWEDTYDKGKADKFTLQNLNISSTNSKNSLRTLLFLQNTDGVIIDNCVFSNIGSSSSVGIYAFSCNYNLTIKNSEIINTTDENVGGGIWVCNLNSASNDVNKTYNVILYNNTFRSRCGDESLALYGRDGKLQKITVMENKFITHSSSKQAQSKVLAIFGKAYSTTSGRPGVGIEDAYIYRNTFDVEDVGAGVICVGSTVSSKPEADILKDIIIEENTINLKIENIESNNACGILGYDSQNISNVKAINNTITNMGKDVCKYGIYNIPIAISNKINGNFKNASIASCGNAELNIISNNQSSAKGACAIQNTINSIGNTINDCTIGIKVGAYGTYQITENNIGLQNKESVYGIWVSLPLDNTQTVIQTGTQTVNIERNTVTAPNKGSVAYVLLGTNVTMIDNIKIGDGKYSNISGLGK